MIPLYIFPEKIERYSPPTPPFSFKCYIIPFALTPSHLYNAMLSICVMQENLWGRTLSHFTTKQMSKFKKQPVACILEPVKIYISSISLPERNVITEDKPDQPLSYLCVLWVPLGLLPSNSQKSWCHEEETGENKRTGKVIYCFSTL